MTKPRRYSTGKYRMPILESGPIAKGTFAPNGVESKVVFEMFDTKGRHIKIWDCGIVEGCDFEPLMVFNRIPQFASECVARALQG